MDEEFCPVHGARLRAASSPFDPAPGDESTAPPTASHVHDIGNMDMPGETPPSVSTAGAESAKHPGSSSLLSRLSGRLRGAAKKSPTASTAPRATDLPPELAGWTFVTPAMQRKSLDGQSLQVVAMDGRRALYKSYSNGSLTSIDAYARLRQRNRSGLASLLAHGHFHGKDFDLIAYAPTALPFDEWLQCNLGEPAAAWFVRQCSAILTSLGRARLAPLWFEPASFVVDANVLNLVDYGKLMQVQADAGRFLASLPASQTEYAGAEVFKTKRWHANSALYSVGAIAMQLLSGHAPTHQATECGDIDLRVIRDESLRSAIQGLLYPDPQGRWKASDLFKWAQGEEVDLPDWSRLRPGAASSAFVLHGQSIHLPSDLAEPLLRDMDLSAERLDEVIEWLNENPSMREVSNEIAIHRRHGRSADWLVLRLAHRLNPACPRNWRGVCLDDAVVENNLYELGRRAMNGDADAKRTIDRLRDADLRGVYALNGEARS